MGSTILQGGGVLSNGDDITTGNMLSLQFLSLSLLRPASELGCDDISVTLPASIPMKSRARATMRTIVNISDSSATEDMKEENGERREQQLLDPQASFKSGDIRSPRGQMPWLQR
ncbi:unnamed protein product [Boreogadus saida]